MMNSYEIEMPSIFWCNKKERTQELERRKCGYGLRDVTCSALTPPSERIQRTLFPQGIEVSVCEGMVSHWKVLTWRSGVGENATDETGSLMSASMWDP